jgi:hypothetical protein
VHPVNNGQLVCDRNLNEPVSSMKWYVSGRSNTNLNLASDSLLSVMIVFRLVDRANILLNDLSELHCR